MKIEVPKCSLSKQKIQDQKFYYLELLEDSIIRTYEFIASEPLNEEDPDLGWEEGIYNYSFARVKRSALTGIEIYNTVKPNRYCILLSGPGHHLKTYFKDRDQAEQAFRHIEEWLFK